jgi:hypothetical protein
MIGRIKADDLDCPLAALSKRSKKDFHPRRDMLPKGHQRKRIKNVFIPDQPGLESYYYPQTKSKYLLLSLGLGS